MKSNPIAAYYSVSQKPLLETLLTATYPDKQRFQLTRTRVCVCVFSKVDDLKVPHYHIHESMVCPKPESLFMREKQIQILTFNGSLCVGRS